MVFLTNLLKLPLSIDFVSEVLVFCRKSGSLHFQWQICIRK